MSLDVTEKHAGDIISSSDFNKVVNAVKQNEEDIAGKYTFPQDGIPKTDLSLGVQACLDNADSAVQPDDEEYERLEDICYYGHYIDIPYYSGLIIEYDNENYVVSGYSETNTHYTIPYIYDDGTHGRFYVTEISEEAFKNNTSVVHFDIPNSIYTIGHDAFNGCSHLTSITIPDSVDSIGIDVFDNTASGFKVYCGNGSAMATYCETNNIPYVTDVESEDLSTKQDKWKLIKDITLTSAQAKKHLVFSPTTGSDTNAAYIRTSPFEYSKIRVYIYAPQSSTVTAMVSNYVKIADNADGSNFSNDDNAKFLGWSALSNTYAIYSYFDIVTSPYMPTYTEGMAMGRLGASTALTKQENWSGVAQNHTKITGLYFELTNANYSYEAGMRFVIMGAD